MEGATEARRRLARASVLRDELLGQLRTQLHGADGVFLLDYPMHHTNLGDSLIVSGLFAAFRELGLRVAGLRYGTSGLGEVLVQRELVALRVELPPN